MGTLALPELVDLADRMTQDLVVLAHDLQIEPKDLVMALAMTQKLLHDILYDGDDGLANMALQEADATYRAITEPLDQN